MGVKLARLAGLQAVSRDLRHLGLEEEEFIGAIWDRANVLDYFPGKNGKGDAFPLGHAREAAAFMWPSLAEYDRVLFCAKGVWDVFRSCPAGRDVSERRRDWMGVQALTWVRGARHGLRGEVAWMPHTSGIVTWWNARQNQLRAADFMMDLTFYTVGLEVRA
jgi:hypothetical protein